MIPALLPWEGVAKQLARLARAAQAAVARGGVASRVKLMMADGRDPLQLYDRREEKGFQPPISPPPGWLVE